MRKLQLALVLTMIFVNVQSQSTITLPINIINQSNNTIYYECKGLYDTLKAGNSFRLETVANKDEIPFLFFLYVKDGRSNTGVVSRTYCIFSADARNRQVIVQVDNSVQFISDKSEKLFEYYYQRAKRKNLTGLVDSMILAHPNDISSAAILRFSLCDPDYATDTITHYFNKLTPAVQHSDLGKIVANYIKGRKALQEGTAVKNFSLLDTLSKKVSLADIKSEYVLLDFWFSRCGPCIQSFPSLIALYNKTSRKRFEVVGLSVDRVEEMALWKSTIRKNGLPWINLLDPGYDLAFKTFSISLYPTKILLDKKRLIVKVNPTDEEIERIIGN